MRWNVALQLNLGNSTCVGFTKQLVNSFGKRPSAFIIGCIIISVRAGFGVGKLAIVFGVSVRALERCEFYIDWKECSVLLELY